MRDRLGERLDQVERRRLDDLADGLRRRRRSRRSSPGRRRARPAATSSTSSTSTSNRCGSTFSQSFTPWRAWKAMPGEDDPVGHAGLCQCRGRSRRPCARRGRSRGRRGRGRCRRRRRCRARWWRASPRRAGRRAGRGPCRASTCATCPSRIGRPSSRSRPRSRSSARFCSARLAEADAGIDEDVCPRGRRRATRPLDRPLEVRDDLGDEVRVARLGSRLCISMIGHAARRGEPGQRVVRRDAPDVVDARPRRRRARPRRRPPWSCRS